MRLRGSGRSKLDLELSDDRDDDDDDAAAAAALGADRAEERMAAEAAVPPRSVRWTASIAGLLAWMIGLMMMMISGIL
jgi:hypothetical protein